MKKFTNIFSALSLKRFNTRHFLLTLIAVTFLVYGFSFAPASAVENITKDFVVTSGADVSTGDSSPFTESEINKLILSDDERMGNESSSWTKGTTYNEDNYIEFVFSPDVPAEAIIDSVILKNEFRRYGAMPGVKIEVWDGINFVDYEITPGVASEDHTDDVNIGDILNTAEKINNFKFRFLAYRSEGTADTTTSHDFVGLSVVYHTPEVSTDVTDTQIDSNISVDTTWTKEASPYIITSPIKVLIGKTLNIEPGVIIKFDTEGELIIDGKINAIGAEDDPIYLTSLQDDTIGGDTNKDGGATAPNYDLWQGIWKGVTIEPSSVPNTNLSNIVHRYSDYGLIIKNTSINSLGLDIDQPVYIYNSSNSSFNKLATAGINLFEGSTTSINNSNINSTDSDLISIYDESHLDISNSKIEGGINDYGQVINVSSGSHLTLNKVDLKTKEKEGDLIWVSDEGSILTINESSIADTKNGVVVGKGSSASISDSTFICSGSCIKNQEGFVSVSDSKISGAEYGIYSSVKKYIPVLYSENVDDLDIDEVTTESIFEINNSEIFNNKTGIYGSGVSIKGENNNIHDNEIGALNKITEDGIIGVVDLKNNYWGDKTGPKNLTTNPLGLGNEVSDNVSFVPFLKIKPGEVTRDPVVLVPGIMGSKIIRDYGDKDEIWPSITNVLLSPFDNFLRDLELLPSGEKNLDYPMTTGDIVRDTPTTDVFEGFIELLTTTGGYIEGVDLFVFPYDWRLSNKESALLLKEKIEQILIDTEKEKVDIIAHSMGGLVTKKYIANEGKDKIDQLMFLGTPHLGSPKAFKALMYGDDMGANIWKIHFLNTEVVKSISQNMPSLFELLPSNKYIDTFGKYVSYVGVDMNYNQTKDYMIVNGRNKLMFPSGENLHNDIDNLNLSDMNVYNFANCDEYTIGKIDNIQRKKWGLLGGSIEDDYKLSYVEGDGTVPFVSANALDYGIKYFIKEVSHSGLPSADGVKETILSILKNETPNNFDNVMTTYSDSLCKTSGKVPSVHSPADMHIYDEVGNHTGPIENGDIEYGIPGVAYDIIGGKKFAFLPDGPNYKVTTKALDVGSYDFYIDSFDINEEKIGETIFLNIPLTSIKTNASVDINPEVIEYNINLDKDGDGIFEEEVSPTDPSKVEEAEVVVSGKETKSSGGSSLVLANKAIIALSDAEGKPLNNFDSPKEVLIIRDGAISKEADNTISKTESLINENIATEEEGNDLTASAGSLYNENSGRIKLQVIIVGGFVLLLLSLKFIFKII